jgi:hypothetical protein
LDHRSGALEQRNLLQHPWLAGSLYIVTLPKGGAFLAFDTAQYISTALADHEPAAICSTIGTTKVLSTQKKLASLLLHHHIMLANLLVAPSFPKVPKQRLID